MEKEELNYVIGWEKNDRGDLIDGYAVMNPERTIRMAVNYNEPVTMARCKHILGVARTLSGRNLVGIDLCHSVYSKTPGNELGDFPEQCFKDKKYSYRPKENSLIISDKGRIVYMNENGSITLGNDAEVTYTDSLDV